MLEGSTGLYALSLRIALVLESYQDGVLRLGVDAADVEFIETRYRELRRTAGSFADASDQAKAEWICFVLKNLSNHTMSESDDQSAIS